MFVVLLMLCCAIFLLMMWRCRICCDDESTLLVVQWRCRLMPLRRMVTWIMWRCCCCDVACVWVACICINLVTAWIGKISDEGLCLGPEMAKIWRWGLKPWVPHAYALLCLIWIGISCVMCICQCLMMFNMNIMMWSAVTWSKWCMLCRMCCWCCDVNVCWVIILYNCWSNILFIMHLIIRFDISPFLFVWPLPLYW